MRIRVLNITMSETPLTGGTYRFANISIIDEYEEFVLRPATAICTPTTYTHTYIYTYVCSIHLILFGSAIISSKESSWFLKAISNVNVYKARRVHVPKSRVLIKNVRRSVRLNHFFLLFTGRSNSVKTSMRHNVKHRVHRQRKLPD